MKMSGAFRCSTARKAESMMSTTGSREIALKYAELRHASGQELPGVVFQPTQSVPCELTYEVENLPADSRKHGSAFSSVG